MIQSWKGKFAEEVFLGRSPKGFPPDLVKAARRRLAAVHAASTVEDLRTPPGNRLHQLTANRSSQWSISINDQFRVCFEWGPAGPENVEIVDYH
ncbi:MAG: Killer protein [Caulobacter sp. 12-67-6]|nr:MAG: Killer protein [Caulobacter sp. 12-67-6]OYX67483.1 MAG: Killer protein [Caulobacter sp. 32-67-35]